MADRVHGVGRGRAGSVARAGPANAQLRHPRRRRGDDRAGVERPRHTGVHRDGRVARRRTRLEARARAVLVPPTFLYGLWYLEYGESQGALDNVPRLPRYVVDEAASSLAALVGRDILWGRVLLGFVIGVIVMAFIAGRRISLCVVAPAVALVANWVLVGYSRADLGEPASSRYVYVGAVYVLVIAADALHEWRGRTLSYATVGFAVIGIWGNWAVLHHGAEGLRWSTTFTRNELPRGQWAADTVDPTFRPNPVFMPPVSAGPYLEAVRRARFSCPRPTVRWPRRPMSCVRTPISRRCRR